MNKDLLKAGIYAIINKRLRIVYVGETQDCFLVRWIEHLKRIPSHMGNYDKMMLYLAEDTTYIVLKELDPEINNKREFYELEDQALEFYKERNWNVLSTSTHNENINYLIKTYTIAAKTKRYQLAVSHMIATIGTREDQRVAVSKLYTSLYKKINQEFNTNVYGRAKRGVMKTLTTAELQFIMLDLYSRYKVKRLDKIRKQYKQTLKQMDLFS
ncbi:hypothetical protein P4679_24675 [Priestia megaterium]|uniref:hypothetical protein n=1 Tax=Priestia megaterium TaxID=1404 RepID=UPI002E23C8DB|nr:hypothetical protein [Priestia megaterium]